MRQRYYLVRPRSKAGRLRVSRDPLLSAFGFRLSGTDG